MTSPTLPAILRPRPSARYLRAAETSAGLLCQRESHTSIARASARGGKAEALIYRGEPAKFNPRPANWSLASHNPNPAPPSLGAATSAIGSQHPHSSAGGGVLTNYSR